MNIQLDQTIKLKSGNCKGKILPEGDSTGTCYLVQLLETPDGENQLVKMSTGENFEKNYPIGSKLIVLKSNVWNYTQKILVNGGVVSEQRIVFHISDILGTVVDTEGQSDGTGNRK